MMRASTRLAVLLVLAALSLVVGLRLGSWAFRRPTPLAGASAASEARLGGSPETSTASLGASEPLDTMREVVEMMQSEYVDKIDSDTKLAAGAVRTLLYTLDDPRTRYWSAEQLKGLERQMQGVFNGIGAVIAIVKETRNEIEQRRVCVVAPVPGGPCSRAGIRAGDYITGVDGRWVIAYDPRLDLNRLALRTMPDKEYRQTIKDASKKLQDGMSWPRALDQLTQAAGKPLKLTIDRPGSAAPFDVEVTREETRVVPAEFQQVRPGVGYLRVTQFTPVAAAAVTEALKSRGAIRRIIVDLRDNAGGPDVAGAQGVVGSASAIVGALGIAGEIGFSAKGAKRTPIVAPEAGDPRKDAPTLKGNLAVLVNRGTANIAEVVAAALRARGGATLVGAATHGDSAYQKLVRLSHGGMTLSAGSYLTTDGKPVPAGGLKPAVKVETGGPATGKDAAFTKALASLTRTDGGNQ